MEEICIRVCFIFCFSRKIRYHIVIKMGRLIDQIEVLSLVIQTTVEIFKVFPVSRTIMLSLSPENVLSYLILVIRFYIFCFSSHFSKHFLSNLPIYYDCRICSSYRFTSDLFIPPRRINYTFLKTMVGTFCDTCTVTSYPFTNCRLLRIVASVKKCRLLRIVACYESSRLLRSVAFYELSPVTNGCACYEVSLVTNCRLLRIVAPVTKCRLLRIVAPVTKCRLLRIVACYESSRLLRSVALYE